MIKLSLCGICLNLILCASIFSFSVPWTRPNLLAQANEESIQAREIYEDWKGSYELARYLYQESSGARKLKYKLQMQKCAQYMRQAYEVYIHAEQNYQKIKSAQKEL